MLLLTLALALGVVRPQSALATDPTPTPTPTPTPGSGPPAPPPAQPTNGLLGGPLGDGNVLLSYGSDGYRYKVVAQGALPGFQAVGFDDVAAGFANGIAAFANDTCGGPFVTQWTGSSDMLLRRTYGGSYVYVKNMPTMAVDPGGTCYQLIPAGAALGAQLGAAAGTFALPGGGTLGGGAVGGTVGGLGGALACAGLIVGAWWAGSEAAKAIQGLDDSIISLAQRDKKKLAGLREALRDHLNRRKTLPDDADVQNHWQRTQQSIEQQIRDVLNRHPQWRQDGDLLIPPLPFGDWK